MPFSGKRSLSAGRSSVNHTNKQKQIRTQERLWIPEMVTVTIIVSFCVSPWEKDGTACRSCYCHKVPRIHNHHHHCNLQHYHQGTTAALTKNLETTPLSQLQTGYERSSHTQLNARLTRQKINTHLALMTTIKQEQATKLTITKRRGREVLGELQRWLRLVIGGKVSCNQLKTPKCLTPPPW